jgi:hypothetical protein
MTKIALGAMVVAAGVASTASAQQAILSFGFTELNGSYNMGTTTFTAVGVDQGVGGALRSTGDVSRLQAPFGTASYDPGTAASRVNVTLAVSGIVGPMANGSGNITIIDSNGDSLGASVSGQFIQNGPAVFFNGTLTNAAFTSVSGDGQFNGPSGGAFPLSFAPAPGPYNGALIQLYIGSPGNFFTSSFAGVSTQVSGAIVPAPASLALLGLGALFAGRRRR